MNAFAEMASSSAGTRALIIGFGGIVAGIWLAILGQWGSIGYGLLMLVGGGFLLWITMMPGMLFEAPATAYSEEGNKPAFYFLVFLRTVYPFAVLTRGCVLVLNFFARRADSSSIIPMLLWSYGVATSPIAWLAQRDIQSFNEYAMVSTFFSQVAYLLVVLVVLFVGASALEVLVLFGIVMLIGLAMQFRIAFLEEKAEHSET